MQAHGHIPHSTNPVAGRLTSAAAIACLAIILLCSAVPASAQPAWVKPYAQGVAAFNAGNCPAAIPYFNEALATDAETSPKKEAAPNDYRPYFPQNYLGVCYFRAGDLTRAKAFLKKGAPEYLPEPVRIELKSILDEIAAGTAEPARTAAPAGAAASQPPPASLRASWVVPYENGLAAVRAKDWAASVRQFSDALARDPTPAREKPVDAIETRGYFPQYFLGLSHFRLGDTARARVFLTAAVRTELAAALQAEADRMLKEMGATAAPAPGQPAPAAPAAATAPPVSAGGAAPAAPSAASAKTYTVKAGDTLFSISRRFCGSTKGVPVIAEANKGVLKGSDAVKIGQVLTIPKC